MTVKIYVGYRKGDWFIVLGDHTLCLYKKDERDAERTRQGQLITKGKSDIITKAALMEEFGQQLKLQLKKPHDQVVFDDCGYFASKGIFFDGVKRKMS
jgi:hypothetical protein